MVDVPNNETRVRILDAAAELFSTHGYAAVRLRDIAAVVQMRHASLYYYAPGGKAQLYIEVMERALKQRRHGITRAIEETSDDLSLRLRAVAFWLLAQPPLDLLRMAHADMPEISDDHAHNLMRLAYQVYAPLVEAFEQAYTQKQITFDRFDLAALSFVSIIEGLHAVPKEYRIESVESTVDAIIHMLFAGWKSG